MLICWKWPPPPQRLRRGKKKRRGEKSKKKKKRKQKRRGGWEKGTGTPPPKKKSRKEERKGGGKKSTPPPQKRPPPPPPEKKERGGNRKEEEEKSRGRWCVLRLLRTIGICILMSMENYYTSFCVHTATELLSKSVTASVALIIWIWPALSNQVFAVEIGQACSFKIRCLQCASVFWSVLHSLFQMDHVEDTLFQMDHVEDYFKLTMLKTFLACLKILWRDVCSVHVLLLMAHHDSQCSVHVLLLMAHHWQSCSVHVLLLMAHYWQSTLSACFTADGSPWQSTRKSSACWRCPCLNVISVTVLAHIGRQGMVRTLAGECTASLGWPWGVCQMISGEPAQLHLMTVALIGKCWPRLGGRGRCAHSQGSAWRPWADHRECVWWTSTVALVTSDGDGTYWAARGTVHTLAGECKASLCWPWWVCQLMCGEPAQLHSTSVMAVAQIGKRGGWCAHSQGSARRPCADHDGCVGWCVVNQHSCTLH